MNQMELRYLKKMISNSLEPKNGRNLLIQPKSIMIK